jgi:hypothetical protein
MILHLLADQFAYGIFEAVATHGHKVIESSRSTDLLAVPTPAIFIDGKGWMILHAVALSYAVKSIRFMGEDVVEYVHLPRPRDLIFAHPSHRLRLRFCGLFPRLSPPPVHFFSLHPFSPR